jgi:DNA polymerase-3 subunit epsilon
MKLLLEKPIVFFDLETSGLNHEVDEIIEFAGRRFEPTGESKDLEILITPSEPISREIEELTGLTNKQLVEHGHQFKSVAHEIRDFVAGADFAGFNVERFDVPFLVAKLKALGFAMNLEGVSIVDAKDIFFAREGRRLKDAVKFYCDREFTEGHRAMKDVDATIDVLDGQIERYGWLGLKIDHLALKGKGEPNPMFVDLEKKFFWKNGKAHFNFGKHRSNSLEFVASKDLGYLRWCAGAERDFSAGFKKICQDAIAGTFPEEAPALTGGEIK